MPTIEENLEKVQYLNNKNLDKAHRKWTGQMIIHWKDGEPMIEEELTKKPIKLD